MPSSSSTRTGAIVFRCKAMALQLRRAVRDRREAVRFYSCIEVPGDWHKWKETRSPLWNDEGEIDPELQRGKVSNLRIALRRLNGARVEANGTFSFWAQIGQATERRGFVPGRLLREGCLMPAIGGGLCQLSNALYELALDCEFEILEHHAHSQVVPGSRAQSGRDAAVAWNYIDLRFRAPHDFVIRAEMTRDELVISFWCAQAQAKPDQESLKPVKSSLMSIPLLDARPRLDALAHSCASCGETSCFRHEARPRKRSGTTAWLVDEAWPEWQSLEQNEREDEDFLLAPLSSALPRFGANGWSVGAWNHTSTATPQALWRSVAMRRAARNGNVWQVQLSSTRALSLALERSIPAGATHLVVAQSLLPHLWQSGALGGRSFDVLLSRTPLDVLAARLDEAFEVSGDATLRDFRAPLELVRAERAALNQANRVFSPHALAAREFGPRARHLEWMMPQAKAIEPDAPRDCLVFPGPAVARKGAQAVRDAVRELKMPLVIVGRDFMGADFWRGVELRVLSPAEPWLPYAHVVVQPALIEHEPRALLHAVAAKVPVIATPQCGLGEREGVAPVAFGDEQSLVEAVRIALRTSG